MGDFTLLTFVCIYFAGIVCSTKVVTCNSYILLSEHFIYYVCVYNVPLPPFVGLRVSYSKL